MYILFFFLLGECSCFPRLLCFLVLNVIQSLSKLLFSQSTIWLEPDNVCPRKIRNLPNRKLRNLSSKWGCLTHWCSELEETNWKWEDKWEISKCVFPSLWLLIESLLFPKNYWVIFVLWYISIMTKGNVEVEKQKLIIIRKNNKKHLSKKSFKDVFLQSSKQRKTFCR